MGVRRARVIECDNPYCDTQYVDIEKHDAVGYHFGRTLVVTGSGGGGIPAFYACKDECVVPALNETLRTAWA